MDEFFKELVERAHYYEQFDLVTKYEDTQTVFERNKEARMEETIIEC